MNSKVRGGESEWWAVGGGGWRGEERRSHCRAQERASPLLLLSTTGCLTDRYCAGIIMLSRHSASHNHIKAPLIILAVILVRRSTIKH